MRQVRVDADNLVQEIYVQWLSVAHTGSSCNTLQGAPALESLGVLKECKDKILSTHYSSNVIVKFLWTQMQSIKDLSTYHSTLFSNLPVCIC